MLNVQSTDVTPCIVPTSTDCIVDLGFDDLSLPFEEPDNVTTRQDIFWPFDRNIVATGAWANLKPDGKYVLPVLMRHCNADGVCYPTMETIAKIAGVDIKTVERGVKTLEAAELAVVTRKRSMATLKMKNTYRLKRAPNNRLVRLFPYIFDAGVWADLVPSAKKVFPVLLCAASMSHEEYRSVIEELERRGRGAETLRATDPDEGRYYSAMSGWQFREWGFAPADHADLKELAGIKDRRTWETAITDLRRVGLVADVVIGETPRLRVQLEKPIWADGNHLPLQ